MLASREVLESLLGEVGVELEGYQWDFLLDGRDIVCWVKSRQVGLSYVGGLWLFLDGLLNGRCGVVYSIDKDEILRKLMYVDNFYELFRGRGFDIELVGRGVYRRDYLVDGVRRFSIEGLSYRKGRGYSGNVLVDECAFIPNYYLSALLRSIFPVIVRSGGGIRLVSTPGRNDSLFHDNKYDKEYVYWWCSKAFLREGIEVPSDIVHMGTEERVYRYGNESLRRQYELYDNPYEFSIEYECRVRDMVDSVVDYEFFMNLVDDDVGFGEVEGEYGLGSVDLGGYELCLGIDIGRYRNMSCVVFYDYHGKVFLGYWLLSGVPLHRQLELYKDLLRYYRVRYCAVDVGGIGMHIGEELAKEFMGIVYPLVFTRDLKRDMVKSFLRLCGSGEVVFSASKTLLSHILDLRVDENGGFRSSNRSHNNDLFWACAMVSYYLGDVGLEPYSSFAPLEVDVRGLRRINRVFKIFGG